MNIYKSWKSMLSVVMSLSFLVLMSVSSLVGMDASGSAQFLKSTQTQLAGFLAHDYQVTDGHDADGGDHGHGVGGNYQGAGHSANSQGAPKQTQPNTATQGSVKGSASSQSKRPHAGHMHHHYRSNAFYGVGSGAVVSPSVLYISESEETDEEPAIRLANQGDEIFINVWITLNPSIRSDSDEAQKYIDLWDDVPQLDYVDTITNEDFESNKNAFCLIDWSVQDFMNVTYKVYHSPDPENDEPVLLYSGSNTYYYVSNDVLTQGKQDYLWVEIHIPNNGVVLSADIPMRP